MSLLALRRLDDSGADDTGTNSERVAALIREQITWGRLSPGEHIPPERALAEQLGCARSVVREALKELRAQGFLASGRGRQGTIVAASRDASIGRGMGDLLESGAAPLVDLYELRMGLEVQSAALAAWRRIPDDIAALDSLLAAMEEGPDERRSAELDAAFHGAVAQATHNAFCVHVTAELVNLLYAHIPAVLDVLHADASSASQLLTQHRAIVTAIRNRDVEGARRAMTVHLGWVVQLLSRLLSPKPI